MTKKPMAKNLRGKKPMAKKPMAKKPMAKKPMAKKPVAKKPKAKAAFPSPEQQRARALLAQQVAAEYGRRLARQRSPLLPKFRASLKRGKEGTRNRTMRELGVELGLSQVVPGELGVLASRCFEAGEVVGFAPANYTAFADSEADPGHQWVVAGQRFRGITINQADLTKRTWSRYLNSAAGTPRSPNLHARWLGPVLQLVTACRVSKGQELLAGYPVYVR